MVLLRRAAALVVCDNMHASALFKSPAFGNRNRVSTSDLVPSVETASALPHVDIRSMARELDSKYPNSRLLPLRHKLGCINNALKLVDGNWEQHGYGIFSGKNVLDIGCGSMESYKQEKQEKSKVGVFEPWFCRCMAHAGARRVAGIDLENNDGEEFEHYQMNALLPGKLSFLKQSEFDLVHSAAVIGLGVEYGMCSANFIGKCSTEEIEALLFELYFQARRLLAEGGFFAHNHYSFKKLGGRLIPYRTNWPDGPRNVEMGELGILCGNEMEILKAVNRGRHYW